MIMGMNGIDISSHQTGIDLSKVPCDFVIIKATQGTTYVNPDFARTYGQAKKLNKCIGLYHYASSGGAEKEAQHFLNTIGMDSIGKAILVLDWESGSNKNWGNVSYAERFLDYIYKTTKITPMIYMSKSVCREYDWSKVAKLYPLWVAQYANYTPTGYKENPWTDKYGYGAWDTPVIFQYSSVGTLRGWNGHLDLNRSPLSETAWRLYASTKTILDYDLPEKEKAGKKNTKIDVSTYPVTKYGHRNVYVRLLQNALVLRGCNVGVSGADGIFGKDTKAAVIKFQQFAFPNDKKEWDGIVGQKTWNALFNQ